LSGIPVYHEDITVYEVTKAGKHVGLWYFDPYARPGKRSGAWMNAYRTQERFKGEVTTIVSNNSNFIKGKPGEPLLISWDDATTLFHEFGHAIHGLNANATYPSVSGTAVARDYVEFPSQLNEHWLPTPQVLNQFALHYQTGKPIPQALVDKIEAAGKFGQGFGTTEYLASALIDMKLHLAGDVDIDPDTFEREELAKLNMPHEIVMRHRTPQFGHVFSSDGYSAGYYSYLWADTLTADVAEAFEEAPGGSTTSRPPSAARHHHVQGQHGRPCRPVPRLPRPRREDRRPDAPSRFPGPAGGVGPALSPCGRGWPVGPGEGLKRTAATASPPSRRFSFVQPLIRHTFSRRGEGLNGLRGLKEYRWSRPSSPPWPSRSRFPHPPFAQTAPPPTVELGQAPARTRARWSPS
jgi:peptidyl-dipeptidase Dcp